MSKTYILLILILVVVAGGLLFLPEPDNNAEISPEELLTEINSTSRFLSVDHVAERIINEDPSIMLVDVRSPDQYASYSLPDALSIPIDEIALPDWEEYLNQEDMDIVLFSNGQLFSEQAWIICTRLGYENLYVLSGGLNQWFEDIMQPQPPAETAPSEEFDLYAFRLAARSFFGGGSAVLPSEPVDAKPVELVKRKKKVVAEGGC